MSANTDHMEYYEADLRNRVARELITKIPITHSHVKFWSLKTKSNSFTIKKA